MELMDGDAGGIAINWIKDVLKSLNLIIGESKRLLVVSVLGVQSSGKSTLLNTMFGLNFAVSSGRCTKGIFAQIVPVDHCMLAVDEINHSLKSLDSKASRIEVAWNGHETLVHSTEYGGAEGSFVQVNQAVNKKLQDMVLETLQENSPCVFFVELYSGDGNFTIPILERFNPKGFSIEYNKKNVERAKDLLTNTAEFLLIEDKAESFGHHFLKSNLESVDHLLTDPPRSGMSEETLQQILRIKPKFIHYISCHPAALARDLKLLTNTYELVQIHGFDMFPQTGHLETYCFLRLNPEAPHDKLG